jgi:hypothetical protein
MLRAMPKAKSKRRSASKASSSKARGSKARGSKRTAAKTKPSESKRAVSTSKSSPRKSAAIDLRVLAAIGLALEDERIANERAEALMQPATGWVALGRARGVRTR